MDNEKSGNIRVLIVDDDEDEYIITKDLFLKIGNHYSIKYCANFSDGLKEILSSEYDICLLDYHMGAHTGIEFINDVVSKACDTPIILLTGQGGFDIDYASMKAGASDYLNKNKFDADTLERTVRYAIERKKAEEKIRYLAFFDQLTDLPNRTLFFDRLKTALASAKRYNRNCAVMFIDIDNFKRINDSLGHRAGDALIREIGQRLLTCIRKEDTIGRDRFVSMLDTVARLGGDEFTILLSEIKEPENVSKVAERIRNNLLIPVVINDKKINVTVSIGMAIYPLDADDLETLIINADIAMYDAKQSGKNSFKYYSSSMNNSAIIRLNLENDLINAVKNNELILQYQPLFDIKTKHINGIEALIRWNHPQKGLIAPMEFIPLAEENGLIINIGDWVLETVLSGIKKWKKKGVPDINIAINISPKQLIQKDFIGKIADLRNKYDFSFDRLIFEITESGIINDIEGASSIINSLKELGIKISLDDFGSGYASFFILRQLAFDVLKIDRSFIKNIPEKAGDMTIISSLITIGHSMKMQVIAEGIETADQLEFLKLSGCDLGQGFLIGRPVSEEDMIKLLIE